MSREQGLFHFEKSEMTDSKPVTFSELTRRIPTGGFEGSGTRSGQIWDDATSQCTLRGKTLNSSIFDHFSRSFRSFQLNSTILGRGFS